MIQFYKQKNKKRGFTLIETLVAIAIFTTSILALMAVLSQGISDTGYVKKKLLATYLAQEGIEYMHNMRNTCMLASGETGWGPFVLKLKNNGCGGANGCYFSDTYVSHCSALTPIITACGVNPCPNLNYNTATGTYNNDPIGGSVADSGFARQITIASTDPFDPNNYAKEVKITSTVSWTQGSGTYQVSFSDYLSSWIQ